MMNGDDKSGGRGPPVGLEAPGSYGRDSMGVMSGKVLVQRIPKAIAYLPVFTELQSVQYSSISRFEKDYINK